MLRNVRYTFPRAECGVRRHGVCRATACPTGDVNAGLGDELQLPAAEAMSDDEARGDDEARAGLRLHPPPLLPLVCSDKAMLWTAP